MEKFAITKPSQSLIATDPAAIAAGEAAKARIQSGYIMAYQKPRDSMESRDRILKACRRSEFAGKAEYERPVGGKTIKGPSIRFAELALREWGNVMTEVTTLYEDRNIRRVRVSALDLETNAQFTRDVQIKRTVERRSKNNREDDYISERTNSYGKTVYILVATDEEMYTKESAWVSKVLRNEGLRLIPTDIIEEGMAAARKTVAERATKDPEGEKKKLLDSFSSLGISPKELQKYIKHTLDILTPPELIKLRAVYQSIREGESVWADYVNEIDGSQPEPETFDTSTFNNLVSQHIDYPPDATLDNFLAQTAQAQDISVDKLKVEAAMVFDDFWAAFETWRIKTYPDKNKEIANDLIKKLKKTTSIPHKNNWRDKHLSEIKALDDTNRERVTAAGVKHTEKLNAEFKEKVNQEIDKIDEINSEFPELFLEAKKTARLEVIETLDDCKKFMACYNDIKNSKE